MVFKNISAKCAEKGISVYQLEKSCGLGNGAIGKWKDASPSVNNLKKVAEYLGCTIDELVKEE